MCIGWHLHYISPPIHTQIQFIGWHLHYISPPIHTQIRCIGWHLYYIYKTIFSSGLRFYITFASLTNGYKVKITLFLWKTWIYKHIHAEDDWRHNNPTPSYKIQHPPPPPHLPHPPTCTHWPSPTHHTFSDWAIAVSSSNAECTYGNPCFACIKCKKHSSIQNSMCIPK